MDINDNPDNTVTIAQHIKCPSYNIRMHVLFCLGIYSRNLKDRAFYDYLCQCIVPCAGIYMCVSCKVAVVSIFHFPDDHIPRIYLNAFGLIFYHTMK